MPPRFAYWTIILDGTPTSFRTKDREDILPLFNQLKAKNPGALLKWFSGGRLWDSPEQAKDVRNVEKVRRFRDERSKETKEQRENEEREMATFREKHGRPAAGSDLPPSPGSSPRQGSGQADSGSADPLAEFRRQHGRPADGSDQRPPAPPAWNPDSEDRGAPRAPKREGRGPGAPDRRGKDWRPGGEHKDPRDKYKLPPGEARKRWKDRNLGPRVPRPFGAKPGGDRPYGGKSGGDRPFGDRPRGPKPFGSPSTRGGDDRSLRAGKPGGDRPYGGKSGGDRPWGAPGAGGRGASHPRAGRTGEGYPSTGGNGPDRTRDRKPFSSKPAGGRPWGDKPRGPRPFGSPSTRGGDDRSLRAGKPGGPRPFGGGPKSPGGPRPFRGKPGKPGKPGGPRRKG